MGSKRPIYPRWIHANTRVNDKRRTSGLLGRWQLAGRSSILERTIAPCIERYCSVPAQIIFLIINDHSCRRTHVPLHRFSHTTHLGLYCFMGGNCAIKQTAVAVIPLIVIYRNMVGDARSGASTGVDIAWRERIIRWIGNCNVDFAVRLRHSTIIRRKFIFEHLELCLVRPIIQERNRQDQR